MSLESDERAPVAGAFSIKPLMFETFACTLALMSFVALIGPIARSLGLAPWQAGLAVTVGGIAWVLFARRWGAASDRLGRRRIILQGLGGFVLSYAALCAFLIFALRNPLPVWLAFAGMVVLRGLVGGFYAAVPATGAALIADYVPPGQRAGALAMLGAASGLGMVAGPGVAGMLAVHGLELPLVITTVLPVASLAVLWRWLPRAERHAAPDAASLKIGDARLRRPMAVAFTSMFCVIVAQVVVGFFALDRLHLDAAAAARAAGIALTAVGVALILAQLLVRRLGWPPERLIRIGCAVSALGFGSILFAATQPFLWIGYFVAAAGMGWVFPSVTALAANAVNTNEQGAAAGTVAAAQGLGIIAGPLAGTLVYDADPGAPYALIAGLLALAAVWPARARAAAPLGTATRR
ncbi:MFS transporter [Achromobacter agilis]|uniref:Tetracycline resistance protein, class C n=1 Tax=Achromobacter agilis TaxID=1353888 RepID=A0A446CX39_9BURK|nr:MFS transporter [Achromobacter agilis]SSW72407.1 Tetracycline resistance protein, class C [Achromobacter agilis]